LTIDLLKEERRGENYPKEWKRKESRKLPKGVEKKGRFIARKVLRESFPQLWRCP